MAPSCAQIFYIQQTLETGVPVNILSSLSPPVLSNHLHYSTRGRPSCQAHLLRAARQGKQRLPRFTIVFSSWEKCSRLVKRGSCFPGEKHSAQPPPLASWWSLGDLVTLALVSVYSAVGSRAHHTVRAGYQGTETGGL